MESIRHLIVEINQISGKLYDKLEVITKDNEIEMGNMNTYYENLLALYGKYKYLVRSETIYELANFSQSQYINDLLKTGMLVKKN